MQAQSQGDTSMSWDLPFNFVSDPYFYSPLLAEPFELVLNKLTQMFSQCDSVQNPGLRYPDSRSRSHFKVM